MVSPFRTDITICDRPVNAQVLYVETRLDYSNPMDPDDPTITVVNIHLA